MKSEEIWLARVTEWRSSGMSSAAFCSGREFEPGSLRSWSSRFGQEGKLPRAPIGRRPKPASSSAPARSSGSSRAASMRIARVVVEPSSAGVTPAPTRAESAIIVSVGDARIAVTAGFDSALLRGVVAALSGSTR